MNFRNIVKGVSPLFFLFLVFLVGCTKVAVIPQSPVQYGSMFLANATGVTIPLNVTDEFKNITMLEEGFTKGTTFVPDMLVMNDSGLYKVDWSISFVGGNNNLYTLSVGVNGLTQLPCSSYRTTTSNAIGNTGASCILNLSINDEVSLMVSDEANPASDVVVYRANLAMLEVTR